MDLFDQAFIDLWRCLNKFDVRYILAGGFATNFHGYQRYTGDVDSFIEDTLENRKRLRKAYADGMGDYGIIETIQFVPGGVEFPLRNGVPMDIQTSLKGVDASFAECLNIAPAITIEGVKLPFLHINHLLANKKAVGRPKAQLDAIELERIKNLGEEGS
jgi:hypothetical protein